MRAEAQRIIDEYLPGRRQYLFRNGRAKLYGDSIPPSQPADAGLQFAKIESHGPVLEQYVRIDNPNDYAVDVSGWQLRGAGIEHRFRPGTVIPAKKALYAVASAAGFRHRATEPSKGQMLFVQGDWAGTLARGKGEIEVVDGKGRVVCHASVE
jgi:hypothetical protein